MQTVGRPEYDEIQSPCSDGKALFVPDSSSPEKLESYMVSIVNEGKVFH